jgi:Na+/alanine symporter
LLPFFLTLCISSDRVDRIFNTESLKIFAVTNGELLGYVGILTTVQVGLLIAWHVAIPQTASLVPIPNSNENQIVQMCFNEHWNIVAGVEYAFLIVLFVFTAFFAWRVRRIPSEEFKESKEIFLAVYNVGFVSVITVPLASVFWYEPNASAAVTAAGCAFASIVSLLVMFAVKFARALRGIDNSTQSDSRSRKSTHSAYSLRSETE